MTDLLRAVIRKEEPFYIEREPAAWPLFLVALVIFTVTGLILTTIRHNHFKETGEISTPAVTRLERLGGSGSDFGGSHAH